MDRPAWRYATNGSVGLRIVSYNIRRNGDHQVSSKNDKSTTFQAHKWVVFPHEFRKTLKYREFGLDRHELGMRWPEYCSSGRCMTMVDRCDRKHEPSSDKGVLQEEMGLPH